MAFTYSLQGYVPICSIRISPWAQNLAKHLNRYLKVFVVLRFGAGSRISEEWGRHYGLCNPGVGDSGSRLAQPRSRLPLPGNVKVKDSVSWDLSQSPETVTIISSWCTLLQVKCSVPDRICRSRYFWASRIQIRILLIFISTLRSILRRFYGEEGRFLPLFFLFFNLLAP